ncbi:glycosyltransferase [Leuconostoc citreum]|uniref:glycosyltransferase n=1 Tax=Leuconostoc citreum TaxID=33964 RepID=UPI0022DFA45D|nr:glycosyltransferase [Leuconostoc citreum]
MKILMALENIGLGGMKRATTVVGNALAKKHNLVYYSFSDIVPFYTLEAPLLVAKTPCVLDNEARPFERFNDEIKAFETVAREFDVVILAGGLLASFAAHMTLPDTRVIGWMHNNVTTYQTQYYAKMRTEFDAGLRALDGIVALTETDLAGFSQYNHTTKIWNPLTIVPDGRADLSQHTIALTSRIAIEHKGLDLALAFAAKLPHDWQLAIAGGGTDSDVSRFHSLVEQNHVADKLIYRGALKDEALKKHYRAASIFLQTSRWEGLPLVLAEAMSFGLPVVAMYNTGSAEVLESGKYGLITPATDVNALYDAIRPLLNNIELREEYAQRSLQRVEDFKIAPILAQWEAILSPTFDN